MTAIAFPVVLGAAIAAAPTWREYPAVPTDCWDADSCTLTIDLGLGVMLWGQKVRLHGVDAPELRGPNGTAALFARDLVRSLVVDRQVRLLVRQRRSREGFTYDARGKYGRWLVRILVDKDGEEIDLGELLVDEGLARRME